MALLSCGQALSALGLYGSFQDGSMLRSKGSSLFVLASSAASLSRAFFAS